MNSYKITKIEYQVEDETGSTVTRKLVGSVGNILFLTSEGGTQSFWIASDRDDLTDGNHVIATEISGRKVDPEAERDFTNTLIGLIKDGACTAYAIHTIPSVATVKRKSGL